MKKQDNHTFGHLFDDIPAVAVSNETVNPLLERGNVRIERIVSRGYSSPKDFWYDQPNDEWVMVLRGRGAVEFDDGTVAELGPGDFLDIPARRRHRVAWTSKSEPTVWLAIHYLSLRPKVRPELSGPPPR